MIMLQYVSKNLNLINKLQHIYEFLTSEHTKLLEYYLSLLHDVLTKHHSK